MVAKREKIKKFLGVYQRISLNRPKFNGKPDICFEITYKNPQGKKIWEKIGWLSEGISAAYASQIRSERLRNLRLGEEAITIQQRKKQIINFNELAEHYLKWSKANKKSWQDDEFRYNKHLKPALSDKLLKEVTPFILESLKIELQEKKLAPATIKHCLIIVRQMFNKAVAWGFYEGENPVKQVKIPKLNNSRLRFLSYEEANLLLNELKSRSIFTHDQSLLSLHCGLRFGEIASLTWGDLNFEQGIINVRQKGGGNRQVYMTPEVKLMFKSRQVKNLEAKSLVFPNTKGDKQKEVSDAYERAVERLGFNTGIKDASGKVVFHTLRHTFASWLAINGTPLYTIKELMGHKTLAMTERYAHLIPDHKRAAVESMTKIFQKYQKKNNDKS